MMKNPPHPGLSVRHDCLEPLGMTVTEGARVLGVTRQALNNLVFVSSASVWEIAIKQEAGPLVFPIDEFEDIADRMGFDVLRIRPRHAVLAAVLPRHHADPSDRMAIAQAVLERLTLVTVDRMVARYDVTVFGA